MNKKQQRIIIILITSISFLMANSFSFAEDFLFAPNLISPEHQLQTHLPPTEFIWNKVAGANYYAVQITTDVLFFTLNINHDIDSKSHNDTIFRPFLGFLLMDTMYFWRVKAKSNSGDESEWSFMRMFQTGIQSITDRYQNATITISPMPIKDFAMISFGNEKAEITQLYLFDNSGVLVDVIDINCSTTRVEFDATKYTSGSYILLFYDKSVVVAAKQIVIQ